MAGESREDILAHLGRTADAAGQQRNNAIVPCSHETARLVWSGLGHDGTLGF